MALLWIEGFEGFGTTIAAVPSPTGVVGRKTLVSDEPRFRIQAGRFGGYALNIIYDSSCYYGRTGLTTNSTLIVGCAVKWTELIRNYSSTYPMYLAFYDGVTTGVNLYLEANGETTVRRGATVLGTTSGYAFSDNTWVYVELKVTCHDTTGSFELRFNGETVLTGSNIDTKPGTNAYHNGFRVLGTSTTSSRAVQVDDLYCCDASGASNNDFLGPCKVLPIFPDSAGDSAQWTPSAGANYAAVDEPQIDDDTTYVETASAGQKDLYNYGSLGETVSGIKGVQVTTTARVTDATPLSLYPRVKSGATEQSGSQITVGNSSYVSFSQLWDSDPNTGAAWSQANLEAAQFGVLS